MQRFEDRLQDTVHTRQHIGIPESQDAKALRSQKSIPMRVVELLIHTLTAVEFDDDRSFQTYEVADEGINRMLPSEFEAIQLTPAQMIPETALGFSWLRAQAASEMNHSINSPR